eukprot:Em0008g515a
MISWRETWDWMKKELFEFRIVFPIFLTLLLTQAIFFESLAFVGHYVRGRSNYTVVHGKNNSTTILAPDDPVKYNDAAALAISIINITGIIGECNGLGTAVDTHCSQAFGSKNYKKVGVVFQRGLLVIGLCMFPILALWLNMQSILTLLQQDPAVVRLTALYMRIFSAALPGIFLVIMLAKYLQAQSIILVFILVGLISNAINVVLHAALLAGAKMGFRGAVVAMTISQGLSPIFVLVYMFACGLHKQTWGGWTWEALEDWWPFIKLAIPGVLMIGLEWWSYEIGGLVLGAISRTQQAIHLNLLNVNAILFLSALAIGITGSIRVGQALGAGKGQEAKRVFYLVFVITFAESVLFAVLMQGLKHLVGRVLTSEPVVIEGMAKVINILSPFLVCDHLQGALGGVLRGSGRHFIGAIVNFVSFYCIGLPIGISLALVTCRGAEGLWIGLFCGAFVETIIFIILLICTDWDKEAKKAVAKHRLEVVEEMPNIDESGIELKQAKTDAFGDTETRIDQLIDSELNQSAQKVKYGSEKEECVQALADEVKQDLKREMVFNDTVTNVHSVASSTEVLIENVSSEVSTPERPGVADRHARRKLLLKRSPFVICSVLILVVGIICAVRLEYRNSLKEYRSSAHCNNSAVAF